MGRFQKDMDAWVAKVGGQGAAFVREFSQEIGFRVVDRTPVDTGFARASWYATVNNTDGSHPNQPDQSAYSGARGTHSDQSPGKAQQEITLSLAGVKIGDTITIANNADYIDKLENGSSQQAPHGMVKVTINEADQIAAQVLADVKSKKATSSYYTQRYVKGS